MTTLVEYYVKQLINKQNSKTEKRGIIKVKSLIPNYIVSFCRIHGLDVHVPVWSCQYTLGPQKGT